VPCSRMQWARFLLCCVVLCYSLFIQMIKKMCLWWCVVCL
jgi:hypothetical protein